MDLKWHLKWVLKMQNIQMFCVWSVRRGAKRCTGPTPMNQTKRGKETSLSN